MGERLTFPALLLGALMLLAPTCAFSQAEEENAYCAYLTQQAMAQASLLRAPEAIAGISQPNTGTASRVYWGISESLANYSKAKLTMEAASKKCESYRATTEAAGQIQYALTRLEKEALSHRAELLQSAIEKLDAILERNLRFVEVRNATRPMLYVVQSIRARLIADRMSTQLKIALLYVPDAGTNVPLKQLIAEKETRESEAQKSIALVNRAGNWDIKMEAGGHQRLSRSFQNPVEPYAVVTFSYNFGSGRNRSHLEKAAAAFTGWKRVQDGEVAHNARILEQQINQSVAVQQNELRALREQEREIDGNLLRLVGLDTTAAFSFGSQLDADSVILQVQIKDVTFRLQGLQDYLRNNF